MSRRLLVSTRKGLFIVASTPWGWQFGKPAFLGDPVTIAIVDPRDGALYAALNLGHFGVKLRRSRDEGKTWSDVGVPSYPDPDKLSLIWSLAAGGPEQDGVLWAGTIPGGLFRSADHGDSWQLVTSLWDRPERKQWSGGGYDQPGIHSILVDPRDSGDIIVGVSCGGVWRTRDNGATWTICATGMRAEYLPPDLQFDPNAQDPHCIVRCAAGPDVLWAQHHNGIFRSTDHAFAWTGIKTAPGSSFGFAVAVHPADPNIAWFVPAVRTNAASRLTPNSQSAARATAAGRSRPFEPGCRRRQVTTWCIAMAWTWMHRAIRSQWVLRPAICGSPGMPASRGSAYRHTCRPSAPSASSLLDSCRGTQVPPPPFLAAGEPRFPRPPSCAARRPPPAALHSLIPAFRRKPLVRGFGCPETVPVD